MNKTLNALQLAALIILIACTPREEYAPSEMLSEDTPNESCDFAEAHQFDFWLGDWELAWGDSGVGSNSIHRILNDCIIQENFKGGLFRGISVSAYNQNTQEWQQTWVDNNGVYLDFTGGLEEDRMILSREIKMNEKQVQQRMVWYNIGPDTLDWNWEVSTDGGETWKLNWMINYTRKQE